MALISSNGLTPACTMCIMIDFSIFILFYLWPAACMHYVHRFFFFVFYSFRLLVTCSFSYFYSTYTTGTDDYYRMTYLAMSKSLRR